LEYAKIEFTKKKIAKLDKVISTCHIQLASSEFLKNAPLTQVTFTKIKLSKAIAERDNVIRTSAKERELKAAQKTEADQQAEGLMHSQEKTNLNKKSDKFCIGEHDRYMQIQNYKTDKKKQIIRTCQEIIEVEKRKDVAQKDVSLHQEEVLKSQPKKNKMWDEATSVKLAIIVLSAIGIIICALISWGIYWTVLNWNGEAILLFTMKASLGIEIAIVGIGVYTSLLWFIMLKIMHFQEVK